MKTATLIFAALAAMSLQTGAYAAGTAISKPKRSTSSGTAADQTAAADASPAKADSKPTAKTVKYRKSKSVDFGNQTIEGNIQRPKTALITGSESGLDSGILRLREDFMDRFAADNGEEIK